MLLFEEVWIKQQFPLLVLRLPRRQWVCLYFIPVLLQLRDPDLIGTGYSDLDHPRPPQIFEFEFLLAIRFFQLD